MSLDINREIASIRNRQGDNFLAIALRKIQDHLNQIVIPTAATPAATTASTTAPTAVTPTPATPAPLVVGGNAITIGGAWPSINVGADPARTTTEGVVKLAQDLGGTADLPKVVGLQTVSVAATAPTDGQLLTYVLADTQWEPKPPAPPDVSTATGILPVANGGFGVNTLAIYANNAAAITGGLSVGDFYRDGSDPDHVCVVH